MKIKMLRSAKGVANPEGSVTMVYEADSIIEANEPWMVRLCEGFLGIGVAVEVKIVAPAETKQSNNQGLKKPKGRPKK